MMVFDKSPYLGCDSSAVPAHQQHLADSPACKSTTMACSCSSLLPDSTISHPTAFASSLREVLQL